MRRPLSFVRTAILSAALVLTLFAAMPAISFAQSPCRADEIEQDPLGSAGNSVCMKKAVCSADESYVAESNSCIPKKATDAAAQTATNVVKTAAGPASFIADTANTLVVKPIIMFILTFAGWMLGIAGVFFNQVLIKTVFQFSTYFGSSEGLLTAWGVMRDVANIGLLFGFIFMGVLLILNVDGGGHGHGHGGGLSAKKAIPRLIIFAVLLNFSLFASQAIIDVSNAFASTFTTLAGAACDDNASTTDGDNACANVGISGKVMQMAGISTIWNDGILKGFETSTVTLLGLAVFVTITMVVLLAAGLMLVFRVVVLTMLMVTSPIGFAGMVIPGLQGLASKWWHMLISQSFFAPVMLLLVFISLKMAESLNPNGAPLVNAFAEANSTMAGNLEVLVVFAVVIGLMISSLIVAAKMGAMGASFATNTASAVTYGSLARITNAGIGGGARGLRAAQQSQWASRVGTRVLGVRGAAVAGKMGEVAVNRALRPLEKSNLDMRRAPGMGAILGAAGITAGAKAAEHATYGDIAHQVTDMRTGAAGKKLAAEYKKEIKYASLENLAHDEKLNEDTKEAEEGRKLLTSLSTKELEALHGIQEGISQMAQNLTPEQLENLQKSDKLDDGQKRTLKEKYEEKFAGANAERTVKAMNVEAVTKLGGGTVSKEEVLKAMSGRQLAAINPDKLNPAQLKTVRDYIAAQRAAKNAIGQEFEMLLKGNPKTQERWGGLV